MSDKTYPESHEQCQERESHGAKLMIVRGDSHYCGYVRFPTPPRVDGISDYIPVHGGITWTKHDRLGTTFGFDCAHSGDEMRPHLKDEEWLFAECERLRIGVLVAAKYEPYAPELHGTGGWFCPVIPGA